MKIKPFKGVNTKKLTFPIKKRITLFIFYVQLHDERQKCDVQNRNTVFLSIEWKDRKENYWVRGHDLWTERS